MSNLNYSLDFELSDNNTQSIRDNLTIIDSTIELQEGHYFRDDRSDATITFQIDNYFLN